MLAISRKLTVAEFEEQYGREKPYYEFWQGEPVQKSTATWMHGLLQRIIMDLLSSVGYKAGSEVKLKIDPDSIRSQMSLPLAGGSSYGIRQSLPTSWSRSSPRKIRCSG